MSFFNQPVQQKKSGLLVVVLAVLTSLCFNANAQNTITYSCTALNFSGTSPLKCNPISEDDPNDLPECYSYLMATMNDGQRLEMGFPAKKGTWHLIRQS